MSKRIATALVWILMSASAAAANNAPASDASIRQMLELTNARQIVEGLKGQMTGLMNTAMQNATRGQPLTPERQAVIDRMSAKMSLVMQNVMREMQGIMKPAQEKMIAIQRETMQELKALQDKDANK